MTYIAYFFFASRWSNQPNHLEIPKHWPIYPIFYTKQPTNNIYVFHVPKLENSNVYRGTNFLQKFDNLKAVSEIRFKRMRRIRFRVLIMKKMRFGKSSMASNHRKEESECICWDNPLVLYWMKGWKGLLWEKKLKVVKK